VTQNQDKVQCELQTDSGGTVHFYVLRALDRH